MLYLDLEDLKQSKSDRGKKKKKWRDRKSYSLHQRPPPPPHPNQICCFKSLFWGACLMELLHVGWIKCYWTALNWHQYRLHCMWVVLLPTSEARVWHTCIMPMQQKDKRSEQNIQPLRQSLRRPPLTRNIWHRCSAPSLPSLLSDRPYNCTTHTHPHTPTPTKARYNTIFTMA